MSLIEVGPHKIGHGHKPFVIAEVGSNWESSHDCLESITKAKMCGADAVKFQLYAHEDLYGAGQGEEGVYTYMRGELPTKWLPMLKEKCDAVGIEFMVSAFSPELLDAVDPFVRIHKLASSEMCHVRMLEKLREYGKPVFMSMAGQNPQDIHIALRHLNCSASDNACKDTLGMKRTEALPVVLMYCVGGYPSNRYNPRAISDMKLKFKDQWPLIQFGLSDHSREVYLSAYRQDAAVIEKHVNFVGSTGPDAPHSLNGEEFKDFVAGLTALPEWTGPTKEEKDFITRHKRRLIATVDVPVGMKLIEGVNYGIYRSLKDDAHAFSPWFSEEVNSLKAKRAIKAGDGIGPGDV